MIPKFKALGLAFAAVFAMTAVLASAAQAAPVFTSNPGTQAVTGSQEGTHVFTTSLGVVKCTTAHFTGNASGTSATLLELTTDYTNCTLAGTFPVDVDETGKWIFTVGTTAAGSGQVHITTTTLTVTSAGSVVCTIHVPAQTVGGQQYTNTSANVVQVHTASTGIVYHATGAGCTAQGQFANGQYTGKTKVEGKGSPGNISVDTE
jgi:hypothetical protein